MDQEERVDEEEGWLVHVPSWRRGDVAIEEDLVEEVMRIYGIDKIPMEQLPSVSWPRNILALSPSDKIRRDMLGRGLYEVINMPFISYKQAIALSLPHQDNSECIILDNPINTELALMRSSIIPSLLKVMQYNMSFGLKDIRIFELAKIYWRDLKDGVFNEKGSIAGLRAGLIGAHNILGSQREWQYYDVCEDVMQCMSGFGLSSDYRKYELTRATPSYYHPGRSAAIMLNNQLLAYCGELHPLISEELDCKGKSITIFEVFFEACEKAKKDLSNTFTDSTLDISKLLSHYQIVHRDLAFVVDQAVESGLILKVVYKILEDLEMNIASEANIFDVYQGENIEKGKKSVAMRLAIRPNDKTMTEAEISKIINNIVAKVSSELGGELRS